MYNKFIIKYILLFIVLITLSQMFMYLVNYYKRN